MFKKEEINIKTKPTYLYEDGSEIKVNMNELIGNIDVDQEKEDIKTCMITGDVLHEPFVELKCGHTYNYTPLYKDLINQKKKFYTMDIEKLNVNEIRCPYCRKKQNGLLPFYELPEVKKVHGINWLDESIITNIYHTGLCNFDLKNDFYDDSCSNNYVIKISDGKTYCYYHQKIMTKEIAKKKAKEEKEKVKAEIKKVMMEKKEKEKELKQKKIQEQNQNIVLCQSILKTGEKKGEICGKKSVKENYCLRHYNLQNKLKQIKN
jgi:uncharacterized Zn finger protein (UPF0148 family)